MEPSVGSSLAVVGRKKEKGEADHLCSVRVPSCC